jgi:hypothetical protein
MPQFTPTHGLRFEETAFYVRHRRREFGPFDYQWTDGLGSVLLTFQGRTYGEICSPEQLYADLREFELPRRVVQVAILVVGCQLQSIRCGHAVSERTALLRHVLTERHCGHFLSQE